jgi:hypothetical protein
MRYLESKVYNSWIMLNNQCLSKLIGANCYLKITTPAALDIRFVHFC